MTRFPRYCLALLLCVFAWPACAGMLAGSSALRAQHGALAAELARNDFGEPLVVRSQESSQRIEGHAYALLDIPFAQVAGLADRASWCELLMLHLNNKYCRSTDEGGVPRIELYVGAKREQPIRSATRLRFAWLVGMGRPDYVAVEMAAPDGPYDTRDYSLAFEAVPVDAAHTFIHLGYAFGYGGASHFAMHLYLATTARDKVGFSRVSPGGEGGYVGGMRGVVERNVMRYVLAIRSHVAAEPMPPAQRLQARLQSWFAATERFPRQLREIPQADYLRMKQAEFARLAAAP